MAFIIYKAQGEISPIPVGLQIQISLIRHSNYEKQKVGLLAPHNIRREIWKT